jgi:hypothetical protein
MIAICNDIDPEVVITRHGLELLSRDVSTLLDMTNERLQQPIAPLNCRRRYVHHSTDNLPLNAS